MSKSWTVKVNQKVAPELHAAAARGLAIGAEHILGEARRKVPIEEATLERSGATSLDSQNLKAAVSFDTPYAVYQHEVLDLKHDAGREAKYLENAMNAETPVVREIIAASIRGEL